jgi:toxin ParE1/3/4
VTLRVVLTPAARSQFLSAAAFIHAENPSAARTFHKKVKSSLSRLREFPASGRILPEFPDLPFREVIVTPFRFFYRVKGKTVWIVAVWHGAQIPDEPR